MVASRRAYSRLLAALGAVRGGDDVAVADEGAPAAEVDLAARCKQDKESREAQRCREALALRHACHDDRRWCHFAALTLCRGNGTIRVTSMAPVGARDATSAYN